MKISGKGILIIIVFLILIPLLIDVFFATVFSDIQVFDFSMTKSLIVGYLKVIPSYLGYLILAFTVLYLIKTKWKKKNDKNSVDGEQLLNNE